jgi:hypothetical protein
MIEMRRRQLSFGDGLSAVAGILVAAGALLFAAINTPTSTQMCWARLQRIELHSRRGAISSCFI